MRQAQPLLLLKPTLFSKQKANFYLGCESVGIGENDLTINDLAAGRTETRIVHEFGSSSGKQSYQISIEEIWSNVLCLLFRASWLNAPLRPNLDYSFAPFWTLEQKQAIQLFEWILGVAITKWIPYIYIYISLCLFAVPGQDRNVLDWLHLHKVLFEQ